MSLYVEGDVPYVANGNCSNGGMGFGGNGWGDLAALIVVAGLFGWGNGGFGFGGGRGGFGCGAPATQADLAKVVDHILHAEIRKEKFPMGGVGGCVRGWDGFYEGRLGHFRRGRLGRFRWGRGGVRFCYAAAKQQKEQSNP